MKRFICSIGLLFLAVCVVLPSVSLADASHARIVRLSLIQGDVRYARSFHDDPLVEGNATWEQAALNLPLREGYVLATGSGRAEVEFESGAMAFLSGNTVVEFYDLSLHDGGRITRLVLRQGSASFYVKPASGDYFSVTGGDFTVEANGRTTFRVDNFDDGSTVKVERGNAAVLRNDHSTPVEKGQSLSVHTGNAGDTVIGRAAENDDFDRWVSGRIESEVTALSSSSQFVNSPYYTAGFADLYTYGSWFSMGGFGNCWRPFGAGLGWSPFSFGDWYADPVFGPTFIGSAQWGWLPYHYGGWISSPMYGWCWNPVGFGFARPVKWRPVTAVWVHAGKKVGIVPLHPLDKNGKTPVNIGKGVFPVQGREIGQPLAITTSTEKWTVAKQAPKGTLAGVPVASTPLPRVSRTLYVGNTTGRAATPAVGSSITYDPQGHRFVNAGNPPNDGRGAIATNEVKTPTAVAEKALPPNARGTQVANAPSTPAVPRASLPPRPAMTPAPAHTSGGGSSRPSSSSSGGGGGGGGGSRGGSGGSSGSSSSSHPSGGGGGGGGGAHPR